MILNVYTMDKKAHSDENGIVNTEPSMTVQDQKDEADINTIVKNFGITGKLPQGVRLPTYGDFEGVSDYRTALDTIRAAEESFMSLPAGFRESLQNDPQQFLEYCADPANLEELRKLGLAVPAAPPESSAA